MDWLSGCTCTMSTFLTLWPVLARTRTKPESVALFSTLPLPGGCIVAALPGARPLLTLFKLYAPCIGSACSNGLITLLILTPMASMTSGIQKCIRAVGIPGQTGRIPAALPNDQLHFMLLLYTIGNSPHSTTGTRIDPPGASSDFFLIHISHLIPKKRLWIKLPFTGLAASEGSA